MTKILHWIEAVAEDASELRPYRIPPHIGRENCAPFDGLKLNWNTSAEVGIALPLPSEEALSDFYANRYRLVMKKAHSFDAYFSSPNYRAQARSQVSWLAPHLGPSGAWLDVGAGFGLLLWQISEMLPGWALYAVEPDAAAYPHLARRAVIEANFGTFWNGRAFDGLQFDVISLSHVLEHVRDPRAALHILRNYLNTSGYLLVEVPHDERSELISADRTSDLPHLWFFSERGVRQLLEEAGFEVIRSAVVGLQRPGTPRRTLHRWKRAIRRRFRGPLSLLEDKEWYAEGPDRDCLRVLVRRRIAD